ncbi:MAG: lysophospholipase [Leptolyngbya sp. SIO1D8]|nr:lysophospholipase [Leptolyngbya sp. SIO1D8]
MQSLTEDCKAAGYSTSIPIASIEQQEIEDNTAVSPAPAAIAPLEAAAEPQFGQSDLCEGDSAERLIVCLDSTPQSERRTLSRPSRSLSAADPNASELSIVDPATPVALRIPSSQRPILLPTVRTPQFSPPPPQIQQPAAQPHTTQPRPTSGPQLYRQRELALQSGRLYTRLSPHQFFDQWAQTTRQPTYQDWLRLLAQEARAAAAGQGNNRLEIVLGDSFGLWLPADTLPRDRLWLNQSISGDTTAGVLRRLSTFASTRPTTIHLMAGVNDLKTGIPEAEIVNNLRLAVQRLRQQHPQAQIVVYSVLPTRWAAISNDRVRSLNTQIATLASQAQVEYRDVHGQFQDQRGDLRADLTTDGLHLNERGYAVWRRAILASAG